MRSVLVLVLLVFSVEAGSGCENICSFLYRNPRPDWDTHSRIEDTRFTVNPAAGKVTGVITARLETFTPDYGANFDFLRFHNDDHKDELDQALLFRIEQNKDVWFGGRMGGNLINSVNPTQQITKNIQISDLNPDFYKIFIGDPGSAESFDYNYEAASTWEDFKNVRLKNVIKIKSDGRCTVYKYISACSDPTPRLCGEQVKVTANVILGSPYTLTCSGSGAPYLDVKWTTDSKNTEIEPSTSHTAAEADHRISSTVTIGNISLEHLGTWTCTILNKNFGDSVTKTYVLQYTYPVSVLQSPPLDYYKNNTEGTEFRWVLQGWPLEQVTLECKNVGRAVTRDESGYTTSIPPRIVFNLVLRNEDVVTCVLKDGEKVLESREITRVGYNCKAGEGGVGKDCEVCETGNTSVAGVGECFPSNSSCAEGYWGIVDDCQQCPDNKTSFPQAVKLQECFPDVSNCKEGRYGYGNNCSSCPPGKTSNPQTKKESGCFVPEIPPTAAAETNLLIPIAGGVGGLVGVSVFAVLLCLVVRRRKSRDFLINESKDSRFVGTTETNAVVSEDPVQQSPPNLPCDPVESEGLYSVVNKKLPQKNLQYQQSDSPDATYAVLDKDSVKRPPQNVTMEEQKTTERYDEMTTSTGNSGVTDDLTYAQLCKKTTVPSTEIDKVKDEDAYSCLKRPESAKKAHVSGTAKFQADDVEMEEDPLYANMEDRPPIVHSDIPVDTTRSVHAVSKSSLFRSVTVEDEDDTYARVELAATSQLRSRPRSTVVEDQRAEYCTILEFQRRNSHEEDTVEVDDEYG